MITAAVADFRAALPQGGRLLGLDVGTKTIGTALCDAGWTIATPAELVRRTKFGKDLAALQALATARTAPAPSRSAPSPAISKRRSLCRSCSGTSAGLPRP